MSSLFPSASPAIEKLINELQKLPGVGPKTAQRLAYHLLKTDKKQVRALAEAINAVVEKIRICSLCRNFTEIDPCAICSDPKRDKSMVCVVEEPIDVIAVEKTGVYRGVYHVLGGAISPIEGITPDKLEIQSLVERIRSGAIKEVIIATNPDTEGEATANYLLEILSQFKITISRLGIGLPIGSELEYADTLTLAKALEARRKL